MSAKIIKGRDGTGPYSCSLQSLNYAKMILEVIDGDYFATEVDTMIEIARDIDLNKIWF